MHISVQIFIAYISWGHVRNFNVSDNILLVSMPMGGIITISMVYIKLNNFELLLTFEINFLMGLQLQEYRRALKH